MAARKSYGFFSDDTHHHHLHPAAAADVDFDESDLWGDGVHPSRPDFKKPVPSSRSAKKPSAGPPAAGPPAAVSLPVNIPDWSKVVSGVMASDDEEEEGRPPAPHEYLARQVGRTRTASLSVHEGVGRTLKGRDLSRVRNAIWEQTGFED